MARIRFKMAATRHTSAFFFQAQSEICFLQAVTSVEAIQSSRSAGQLQQLLHPQKLTKDMLHTVKVC